MTWNVVATAIGGAYSQNNAAAVLSAAVQIGDIIAIGAHWDTGGGSTHVSATDSLGNGYGIGTGPVDSLGVEAAQGVYAIVTVAGTPTITVRPRNGSEVNVNASDLTFTAVAYRWSDGGAPSFVAGDALQSQPYVAGVLSGPAVTAEDASSLIVSTVFDRETGGRSWSAPGSGYSSAIDDTWTGGGLTSAQEYRTADAGAITPTWAGSGGDAHGVTVMVFAPPTGGGAEPDHLAVTTKPDVAIVGEPFTVVVESRDSEGVLVGSDQATEVTATVDIGTLGGTTTVTVVDGVAAFDDLTLDTPGATITLSFQADALDGDEATIGVGDSYETGFDATENPLSEGGKWRNGAAIGLQWNNFRQSDGRAYGTATPTNYDDCLACLRGTWFRDQQAAGTIYRAEGYAPFEHELSLLVNFTLTANVAHGYELILNTNGGVQCVRWNGPIGDFDSLGTASTATPAHLDTARAKRVGDTIQFYHNDVLIETFDLNAVGGTIYDDGAPGIGSYAGDVAANYGWADFAAQPVLSGLNSVDLAIGHGVVAALGAVPSIGATADRLITLGRGMAMAQGSAPIVLAQNDRRIATSHGQAVAVSIAPSIARTADRFVAIQSGLVGANGQVPSVQRTIDQFVRLNMGTIIAAGHPPVVLAGNDRLSTITAGLVVSEGRVPLVQRTADRRITLHAATIPVLGSAPSVRRVGDQRVTLRAGLMLASGARPMIDTGSVIVFIPAGPIWAVTDDLATSATCEDVSSYAQILNEEGIVIDRWEWKQYETGPASLVLNDAQGPIDLLPAMAMTFNLRRRNGAVVVQGGAVVRDSTTRGRVTIVRLAAWVATPGTYLADFTVDWGGDQVTRPPTHNITVTVLPAATPG